MANFAPVQQAPQTMQLLAPDLAAQQLAIQRQQQYADLLRQQGATPIDTSNRMVTGAGPAQVSKISPVEGLAKLLQSYVGGQQQRDGDAQQLDIARQYQGKLAAMLKGPAAQIAPAAPGQLGSGMMGDFTPANGAPVVPQVAQPGSSGQSTMPNNFNLDNILHGQAIEALGGNQASGAYWDSLKLPDAVKINNLYGIDPGAVKGSMLREMAIKGQVAVRPGQTLAQTNEDSSITPKYTAPDFERGINAQWVNGVPSASPITGSTEIRSANAAADMAGKNTQTIAPADQQVVNPDGTRQVSTVAQTIAPTAPASRPVEPSPKITKDGIPLSSLPPEVRDALQKRDPEAFAQIAKRQGLAPQGVGMPLGLEDSVKGNVKTVNDHFTGLNTANSAAPVEIDALNNMKKYAKGAIIGANQDTREYVNGLQSLIPSFSSAMNAKTQTDLFNKSAARMTLSASNQAGATDAMRTLASAAVPGNHMNEQAVHDAADQLIALKKMSLATQKILEPLKLSNNVQEYQETLSKINNAFDPKVFEFNEKPKVVQQAMVGKMTPDEARAFLTKRQSIKNLGGM